MENTKPALFQLTEQILKLDSEQQRRLADVATGMTLQKEIDDKKRKEVTQ